MQRAAKCTDASFQRLPSLAMVDFWRLRNGAKLIL
jgi:hypothetical protein